MLKPLNDHVIVKPLSEEKKSEGGIIIPDTVNKEKPEQGEVIAVGPGKLNDKGERSSMSVKVGDKVVFTKYSPNEVKIDNVKYLVLSESDILAIIE
jgi:chaperonin GroES